MHWLRQGDQELQYTSLSSQLCLETFWSLGKVLQNVRWWSAETNEGRGEGCRPRREKVHWCGRGVEEVQRATLSRGL